MSNKAMSLKAKIRNLAKKNEVSAQVILQNYMFECFLKRLSNSDYKDKFILKGGLLIASLVGLHNRSTMDMDVTIRHYSITLDLLTKTIRDICSIKINDDVKFIFVGIEAIREDDAYYGGYRVSIRAEYDTIFIPMHIDITSGDVITPNEVLHSFKMIFENNIIRIFAYNIETILAEKVETILRRGELNTRPRDFYDVYILTKTQIFEQSVFKIALKMTAEHRETTYIFNNINKRIADLQKSENLRSRWIKYTKEYRYAEKISYEEIMKVIITLLSFSS